MKALMPLCEFLGKCFNLLNKKPAVKLMMISSKLPINCILLVEANLSILKAIYQSEYRVNFKLFKIGFIL